jgi:hypothetical protein
MASLDDLLRAWDQITLGNSPLGCPECGAKLPKHSYTCSQFKFEEADEDYQEYVLAMTCSRCKVTNESVEVRTDCKLCGPTKLCERCHLDHLPNANKV